MSTLTGETLKSFLPRRTLLSRYLPSVFIAAGTLNSRRFQNVDRDDHARQLEDAIRALMQAFDKGLIDEIAAHHAENAFVSYPPGPFRGREAIRGQWERYYNAEFTDPNGRKFKGHHPVTSDTVRVDGNMAYSRGRFWHGEAGTGIDNYLEGGYYLAVWERISSKWQIVSFAATVTRTKPSTSDTASAR